MEKQAKKPKASISGIENEPNGNCDTPLVEDHSFATKPGKSNRYII